MQMSNSFSISIDSILEWKSHYWVCLTCLRKLYLALQTRAQCCLSLPSIAMGPGQKFLTLVGSGQFFVARVGLGQPFIVWVWISKIFPKNVKFFNFFPSVKKKLLRVGSESTQVKAGLASYLLRVKSKLGSGRVGSGQGLACVCICHDYLLLQFWS